MDVFFSYRRETGTELTRSVKIVLNSKGYTTFFDNDSIGSGIFSEKILNNIAKSDNFVLMLTPHTLERCVSEDDWVRKEIEEALRLQKNIIPFFHPMFAPPDNMPESIQKVLRYQGVRYDAAQFDASVEQLISYLRDKDGNALRLKKKKNISNLFYANGMAQEERVRIAQDYEVVKSTEKKIWDKLLSGKSDLILFAPAIYDIDVYMRKYDRKEFSHVFGMVNTEPECEEANRKYGGNNRFYTGNMEHENFEDEMDQILSDNDINGFDFADLTLILRDSSHPSEKLQKIVDRMNPGGVVYVREFDHSCAMAYPDEAGNFNHLMQLIKDDIFSGDFYAGRKVYSQMLDAYLDPIELVDSSISTVGLSRKEKGVMFEALFSYLPREYRSMMEQDPDNKKICDSYDWLLDNYQAMKREFMSDTFFYRAGYMFFYGYKDS